MPVRNISFRDKLNSFLSQSYKNLCSENSNVGSLLVWESGDTERERTERNINHKDH